MRRHGERFGHDRLNAVLPQRVDDDLCETLARYQQGGKAEFSNFLTAVESYAAFHWEHMRAEEEEAMPLAEKYLSAADWEAVDAAFLGHSDPMLGAEARTKYDRLFTRIVNLAPAPIGLGPAHR